MSNNSLKSSKTPGVIVSEIKMMGAAFSGAYFLVEGDCDSKFWRRRLRSENISIVHCEGKPNLLGAAAQAVAQAIAKIVGVYDHDFDRLVGVSRFPRCLVPTDENDLETMLLRSDALPTLLAEYADDSLVRAFEARHSTTVLDHVERTSREFGMLRYFDQDARLCVDFDSLSPYRFVSESDWILDAASLYNEYARLASISISDLRAGVASVCSVGSPWAYSQGHDAIRILARGLRRSIGRCQMNEHDVSRVLRIAYTADMLKRTSMYSTLCGWESHYSVSMFASS